VPVATFVTRDDSPPVYDTTKLVVSMPDANGLVQVTAPPGTALPASARLAPSLAAALLAAERGASVLRVHDVKETVQAMRVLEAIR